MLAKMSSKGSHPLLVGLQTCTAVMKISVVVPQEDGIYHLKVC